MGEKRELDVIGKWGSGILEIFYLWEAWKKPWVSGRRRRNGDFFSSVLLFLTLLVCFVVPEWKNLALVGGRPGPVE